MQHSVLQGIRKVEGTTSYSWESQTRRKHGDLSSLDWNVSVLQVTRHAHLTISMECTLRGKTLV